VPPKTDFSDIESIKKEIQRIQNLIRELSLQKAGITTTNEYIFTRNLYMGIRGQDVRELQRYLNNNGFKIASSGDGSKGNETEFFGQLTKNALIKFQNANKIYPSTGFFGPITRSFILKNKQ
jgi:peptidoglycan hydrolase-like protein with peptidoglycan-binding domain